MKYLFCLILFPLCFVFCKTPAPPEETVSKTKQAPPASEEDAFGASDTNQQTNKVNGALPGHYFISEVYGMKVGNDLGLDITINQKQDFISGFTSCNRYEGNLNITGKRVKISGISASEKGCDTRRSEAETALYNAFRKAHSYAFASPRQLHIKSFDGSVLIVCNRSN